MPRNTATGDANIRFEIVGYTRVLFNLREVMKAHPQKVDDVMQRWAENTRMFLKRTRYPAKPANSRYTRTGRLASSWRKEKVKPAVWSFYNDAASPKNGRFYARYVVGRKTNERNQGQAWMHRNRWWNADKVIEEVHIPELRIFLDEMYVNLWEAT
jgi:hypothetical protein